MDNAIQQINRAVQDRQLPDPTPLKTSTSTLRGDDLSREQRQAVNYFYSRLKSLYGSKYKVQFPVEQGEKVSKEELISKMEWSGQVMNLTREDIDRGMNKLKPLLVAGDREFQWPNVPRIAELCQPQPENFGLSTVEQAWDEAAMNSQCVDKHHWSHEAVREAGRRTGWFEIMSAVSVQRQKTLKETFERHYRYLVSRVMEGKSVRGAQALLESDQQKQSSCLSSLSDDYNTRHQMNVMKAQGVNPAGGRSEFLKMRERLGK